MIMYGRPPFLECSTRGDVRFSPFFAKVDGQTIEDQYHAHKILESLSSGLFTEAGQRKTGCSWQEAKELQRKGWRLCNAEECKALYKKLWLKYVQQNPRLIDELLWWDGVSDIFGQPDGLVCQATELWELRERALKGKLKFYEEYKARAQDAWRSTQDS